MSESTAAPAPAETEVALAELAAYPDELAGLWAGRAAESLVRPASDGGWSVVENLCHLRDWEEIFLARAKAVIEQERPELPAYDDELWPIEHDYRRQQPERVFEQFRETRRRLVALLAGSPPEVWQRAGHHELRGELTIRGLVEMLRTHGEEHRAQIREALS
jgi:hypothetical protein